MFPQEIDVPKIHKSWVCEKTECDSQCVQKMGWQWILLLASQLVTFFNVPCERGVSLVYPLPEKQTWHLFPWRYEEELSRTAWGAKPIQVKGHMSEGVATVPPRGMSTPIPHPACWPNTNFFWVLCQLHACNALSHADTHRHGGSQMHVGEENPLNGSRGESAKFTSWWIVCVSRFVWNRRIKSLWNCEAKDILPASAAGNCSCQLLKSCGELFDTKLH